MNVPDGTQWHSRFRNHVTACHLSVIQGCCSSLSMSLTAWLLSPSLCWSGSIEGNSWLSQVLILLSTSLDHIDVPFPLLASQLFWGTISETQQEIQKGWQVAGDLHTRSRENLGRGRSHLGCRSEEMWLLGRMMDSYRLSGDPAWRLVAVGQQVQLCGTSSQRVRKVEVAVRGLPTVSTFSLIFFPFLLLTSLFCPSPKGGPVPESDRAVLATGSVQKLLCFQKHFKLPWTCSFTKLTKNELWENRHEKNPKHTQNQALTFNY